MGLTGTSSHHLGNADALALTTTDTSHKLITNESISRVLDVQHPQQHALHGAHEASLALVRQPLTGRLGVKREPDGLAHCQSSIVHIGFGIISSFALVGLEPLGGFNARVFNIATNFQVFASLARDSLQECGASTSGTTEHQNHLTRLREPSESFE